MSKSLRTTENSTENSMGWEQYIPVASEPPAGVLYGPLAAERVKLPDIQVIGKLPPELDEAIMRIWTLCRQEDFDAKGEMKRDGVHVKWEYLKETKVMLLSFPRPQEIIRHRSGITNIGGFVIWEDPTQRNLHCVAEHGPAITACGRNLNMNWKPYMGLQQVTCPECVKVIEGR